VVARSQALSGATDEYLLSLRATSATAIWRQKTKLIG
jgi:hypothetical protein